MCQHRPPCPTATAVGREAARAEAGPLWPLPHRAEAARTARRLAHTVLGGWGVVQETIDDALLVVSELITNAVEHALPPSPCACNTPRPTAPYAWR